MFDVVHWNRFGISLLFGMFVNWNMLSWIWLWNWNYCYDYVVVVVMDIEYWILDCSTWVVTAFSILMPVVSGCSRIDLNRAISMMICFVYSYACILLLGVSSRVLFYPQIKVKAKLTNSELGGRGRLYMWASCVGSWSVVMFYLSSCICR